MAITSLLCISQNNEGVIDMSRITYKYIKKFDEKDIENLYEDAGWTNYTKNIPKLMEAIEASLMVVSALDDEKLIGLVRAVGDGITIVYIQDIIVLSEYKRKGIGSRLLKNVLGNYKDVRQKILLTDDREETRGFYEKNGFFSCDKGDVVAFARFDQKIFILTLGIAVGTAYNKLVPIFY